MSSPAFSNTDFARFVSSRIDALDGERSPAQIASAIGFRTVAMLTMIRNGDCRLPLDRTIPLAHALDVDPAHLFRLALEAFWPTLMPLVATIAPLGIITSNELAILQAIRDASGDRDPKLSSQQSSALESIFRLTAEAGAGDLVE